MAGVLTFLRTTWWSQAVREAGIVETSGGRNVGMTWGSLGAVPRITEEAAEGSKTSAANSQINRSIEPRGPVYR
jgi:hypothetical protein